MRKRFFSAILGFAVVVSCFISLPIFAIAANSKAVEGTIYEFDGDSKYELSEAAKKTQAASNAYGALYVDGEITSVSVNGTVPAYKADKGSLTFRYAFSNEKLIADADQWHIIDDKGKKIDNISLNDKIMKGAIIVQTSKDQKNWVTEKTVLNVFGEEIASSVDLYTTNDLQHENGCYFRIIVAYELERQTEQKNLLFLDTSKYEQKKIAEEYYLYVYSSTTDTNKVDPRQTYSLGSVVRVDQFDGYWGEKPITKDDPHYDVTLGQFFVSGYTDNTTDKDGSIVFLKNVGDKVTLWFHLNENIDGFEKNAKVKVTADENGSDQYFHTPPTNFGRGALIVKYTDYNNNSTTPQIYTNYLEANAEAGADTTVRLCEEGDYEVALDYQLTEDKVINTVGHYRIFFKFKIRNGNCMVYPFDLATGCELVNSSMTENGFRLDLAKSRYLKTNVKREMLAEGADGLVEDVRANGPAKDGAEYKEDGIYTITVTNQYTNQRTEKKIYVGTNPVLKAYMVTGISIPEINNLVAKGATINADGTIVLPQEEEIVIPSEEPAEEPVSTEVPEQADTTPAPAVTDPEPSKESNQTPATSGNSKWIVFCVISIIDIIAVVIVISKKRKQKVSATDERRGNQ